MDPPSNQYSEDRLRAALSDRYTIEREIGRGGMATVFLAHDAKHDRKVAVKVLRPELANLLGAERFLNEIKVTAGLHHPHILALHDSGEADSFLYYVMPYVEGESLRDKLQREGRLPIDEVTEIIRELADALAYAHARGIVHRDIKPGNVLLSGRHALLADLGISKAVGETGGGEQLTTVGVVLGTPDYMAPEQAVADRGVDHRTDIYALGILAYQMLAGQTPFEGRSARGALSAHLVEKPTSILHHRPELLPPLAQLVMRCLEKEPDDRWQSAEDIVSELGRLAMGGSEAATLGGRFLGTAGARGRRIAQIGFIASALVAGAALLVTALTGSGNAVQRRIAVLPFENLSGAEDDAFSEGITRDINTRIAKIGTFTVIAHGSSRLAKASGQSYRDMADQLGVHYLVDGSVSLAGERVLINAALIDPDTDEQIWTNAYDEDLSAEHIFNIRGDVAQQVARALDVTLSPTQEAELSRGATENVEAYQEYHLGIFHYEERTPASFEEAITHFERAIALDSAYALPYAGLADVYLLRPWFSGEYSNFEALALADSLARKALSLDPTLAQPHATLALVHQWQYRWEASEREFLRSIDLDPEYAPARHWYGNLLARLDRDQEAQAELQLSLELDPLSPIINQDVGYVLQLAGDRDAALRQYERTVELHPDFSTTVLGLGMAYVDAGRFEEAREVLARWANLTGNHPGGILELVDLVERHATTGEPQLPTNPDFGATLPPYTVGFIYLLLGQPELALDYLEAGYEEGAFGVVSLMFTPRVDELHSHPRFRALAEKVGLEL